MRIIDTIEVEACGSCVMFLAYGEEDPWICPSCNHEVDGADRPEDPAPTCTRCADADPAERLRARIDRNWTVPDGAPAGSHWEFCDDRHRDCDRRVPCVACEGYGYTGDADADPRADRDCDTCEGEGKIELERCPDDCDGGEAYFSWAGCDVCGSRLGGNLEPYTAILYAPEVTP